MAFPTTLDVLTNPTPADTLGTTAVLHSTQHANANDAIEAIEAKVGINGSTDATSLDYLLNVARPRGALTAPALVTTTQSGISGEADLTNVTVAPTVGTSRRVRVTCEVTVGATVTDDQAMLRIKEGATTLVEREAKVTAGRGVVIIATAWLTPTAGVHTYKATLARVVGTGTLSAGSANAPSAMSVEDVGGV